MKSVLLNILVLALTGARLAMAAPADESARLNIPDAAAVDQDGRRVRFVSDLTKGRVVAVNFVFTTCPTVCPIMGANFGALQDLLKTEDGKDVRLISVSLTPKDDTPKRMKAWGERFNACPSWTLLTGQKREIEGLLKAFQAFSADPLAHQPMVFIGTPDGNWSRLNGLTPPEKLAETLLTAARAAKPAPAVEKAPATANSSAQAGAARYLPDTTLIDQDGKSVRFYTDLVRGKTVVIHSFFASCKGACPVMLSAVASMQDEYEDRLGKDFHLISITVDPERDSPEALKATAAQYKARPGWHLLTGKKEDVDQVLRKIGQFASVPENHSNLMIVGNEPTGLWKKTFGLGLPKEMLQVVESVLNDDGSDPAASTRPSASSQAKAKN